MKTKVKNLLRPGFEPGTFVFHVRRLNHSAIEAVPKSEQFLTLYFTSSDHRTDEGV